MEEKAVAEEAEAESNRRVVGCAWVDTVSEERLTALLRSSHRVDHRGAAQGQGRYRFGAVLQLLPDLDAHQR